MEVKGALPGTAKASLTSKAQRKNKINTQLFGPIPWLFHTLGPPSLAQWLPVPSHCPNLINKKIKRNHTVQNTDIQIEQNILCSLISRLNVANLA